MDESRNQAEDEAVEAFIDRWTDTGARQLPAVSHRAMPVAQPARLHQKLGDAIVLLLKEAKTVKV